MRIGLDARFLTHPQRGGFKTYTVNLINAICRLDDENEYIIYLDRCYNPDELPSKKNFVYRILNGKIPLVGMILREQVLLPYQIGRDNVDFLHSLCNTAPVSLSVKRVITLHDTIQVVSQNQLQHMKNLRSWMITAYSRWSIIRSIYKSTRVITVSSYEKSQIIRNFNFPPAHVAVTYLAANSIYKPIIASDERKKQQTYLQRKFAINGAYILGIGYEDRKNIPLIIEAFRLLAHDFPGLNLVIVSAVEHKRLQFQQLGKDFHLEGRLTILGSVPAVDLVALYNLAKVFVFPSERESFGLPPLEAISCGTPTIAMNSSSIPEILQDCALIVDGKDPQKWADAIRSFLLNEKIRLDFVERGLKRAAELSWEKCAQETLRIYQVVDRARLK